MEHAAGAPIARSARRLELAQNFLPRQVQASLVIVLSPSGDCPGLSGAAGRPDLCEAPPSGISQQIAFIESVTGRAISITEDQG
jgi:hypothetical protein